MVLSGLQAVGTLAGALEGPQLEMRQTRHPGCQMQGSTHCALACPSPAKDHIARGMPKATEEGERGQGLRHQGLTGGGVKKAAGLEG